VSRPPAFEPPPPRPAARSLRGALRPGQFEAFPGVAGGSAFQAAWAWRRHWCLANLAHAVYQTRLVLAATGERIGADDLQLFERDGARAVLLRHGGLAVLVFRGTVASGTAPVPAALRERTEAMLARLLGRRIHLPARYRQLLIGGVLTDLRVTRVRLGGAAVHRGFAGELRKLWRPLCMAMRALPADAERYAAGHSLGGALATLAATRRPFREVVTFGEPRVGRDLERAYMGELGSHLRFINGCDPVPRLPPARWPFGYRHHGRALAIGDAGSGEPIYDHGILDYADKIAAMQ